MGEYLYAGELGAGYGENGETQNGILALRNFRDKIFREKFSNFPLKLQGKPILYQIYVHVPAS